MTASGGANSANGANGANGIKGTNGVKPSWEELAAKKRSELLTSIPKEWRIPENLLPPESQKDVTGWPETSGWFTGAELDITSLTASELVSKLASGALRSEDVTRAFCKRASAAHQLTNCLSEIFFDRAIAMARARDEYFAETGKPMGPLHGLPISLKDNINVKSVDSTVGMATHVGDPAKADATLAEVLEDAGAVFYVKTNVPTAMMIAESVNNVFGRTLNPRNRQTTSGGSSGGESALIVMKGSPVGVGSDIGGSLRIPAACTGIFTLRPSFGRFPVRNCRSGMPGQEAVPSVNGPLAPTLEDVKLYSKAVINGQPWLRDPKCLPIPWREPELPSKLRIGVMWHDGMVQPTPPVARALKHTVAKLKAAGHEIVDWDHADQAEGYLLLQRMFVADGGLTIKSQLEPTGEPWRNEMYPYSVARELGTAEMWRLHLERTDFQNRHLDRWNMAGIDALLLPTIPFNTVRNGAFRHVAYTGVYNVLDYSAVSFPTGLDVDGSADMYEADYTPLSGDCKDIHETYEAELMHGLPISLQLVARRLEEEKVLAMTGRVLEALSA
ncbi:amidase [Trichoderma cornu-damae]|uniref:Amidase n=1 Tax=Trichoderma cornu-damae TaxID=654480 RepID=A0A9P8QT77_9HYPO|nr:amidase [Trichoderma cornu-damae]